MRNHLTVFALFFLSAFVFIPAIGQPTSPYAVTDFLAGTFFIELEVSPDARHVALITLKNNFATDRKESVVWKIDVDAQGQKTGMSIIANGLGEFSGLKWSSDSRYLVFKSIRARSIAQLMVFDLHSNKAMPVTTEKKFKNGITAFDLSADGRRIFFAVNDVPPPPPQRVVTFPQPEEPDDHSTFYRLAFADLGRKDPEVFVSMAHNAREFAISPDEKTIAFKPVRALFLLDTTGNQTVRRLTPPFPCLDPGMKWAPRGIIIQGCGGIKDGRMIRTQRRIYLVDPANGHMEQLAPEFTGELWHRSVTGTGDVLAIGNISTRWQLYKLEGSTSRARQMESPLGPIQRISLAANGKLAAFVPINEPEVYLAPDIDHLSRATKVTNFNANVNKLPKAEVQTIRWSNNDGDTIEGLLYFPPGQKGAMNLPPHS